MKYCQYCRQSFSDEIQFCLNDGTPLENFISSEYQSYDSPTVFTPNLYATPSVQNRSSNSNKWVYPLIGILLGAVVVLGFFAFYKAPAGEKENKTENSAQVVSNQTTKNQTVENNAPIKQTVIASPEKNEVSIAQIETPPINADAVRGLLNRWVKSQNERNFATYRSCYSESFLGIKRTKTGGESRMNYAQWLGDRQKMLQNTISVGIQNPDVSIEGDTAIARFVQQFQSINYNDEGQKILRIKMFSDGAKIIYEEMKYAY